MEGIIWAVFVFFMLMVWAIVSAGNDEKKRKQKAAEEQARLNEIEANAARLRQKLEAAYAAREKRRLELIEQMRGEWGDELCERLINKKVTLDMNQRMVASSWGKPDEVDQKTVSKTGIDRERWVYGEPRKGAQYVYFKNGLVDKIQSS